LEIHLRKIYISVLRIYEMPENAPAINLNIGSLKDCCTVGYLAMIGYGMARLLIGREVHQIFESNLPSNGLSIRMAPSGQVS